MVRTPDFQSGNMGSIPIGATTMRNLNLVDLVLNKRHEQNE